jgi:epoxyqueuosine reductase
MRDLQESIRRLALDLGFDAVGFAPAARAPHADAWLRWLDAGYAADMRWLARAPERRADPRRVMPAARSAVVVALSYFTREPPPRSGNDPARGRVARYAWGRDYHDIMRPMLAEPRRPHHDGVRPSGAMGWRLPITDRFSKKIGRVGRFGVSVARTRN